MSILQPTRGHHVHTLVSYAQITPAASPPEVSEKISGEFRGKFRGEFFQTPPGSARINRRETLPPSRPENFSESRYKQPRPLREPSTIARSTNPSNTLLTAPEVTVWTSPQRAALAGALLDVMGTAVRPLGVGGPRSAELDTLGKQLDCPAENDLRKLLIERPAAFLLVTSLRDAKPADLHAAAEAGTRVLCLEPLAAELDELAAVETPARPAAVTFIPAFIHGPGFLSAADPEDQLGSPRLIRFSSLGRPEHGSLLARLTDAWATVLRFTALPETLDASLASPAKSARELTGYLAAHGRCPDGNTVVLEASDTAAHTRRELSVLSDTAQLRVGDGTYELRRADGSLLDASEANHANLGPTPAPPTGFIDLIAAQWRWLLERPAPPTPPSVRAGALACVHACLLSARTRQPESPAKLLQLSRI